MLNLGNVPYQIPSKADCQLRKNCVGVLLVTQLLHFSGPCPVEVHCACCTAVNFERLAYFRRASKGEKVC